jgi:two-component system, OmpR family, alkaline phosphatase synthesis response regulator PhoP
MPSRILLVEDEPGLVLTLTDRLKREGHEVESVADAEHALASAGGRSFDLIVLDVGLPNGNGFDVCRTLRGRGIGAPIIMLTARGQLADKVAGLKLGADDYVTKPFEMAELVARIEAQLRRGGAGRLAPARCAFGDVRVDFARAEVHRAGDRVELAARELRLLQYFIEHRGEALTRERLLDEVWGYHATPSTRTVDVHVAWLRQKLEPVPHRPQFILTVHGIGYKFVG